MRTQGFTFGWKITASPVAVAAFHLAIVWIAAASRASPALAVLVSATVCGAIASILASAAAQRRLRVVAGEMPAGRARATSEPAATLNEASAELTGIAALSRLNAASLQPVAVVTNGTDELMEHANCDWRGWFVP